MLSGSNAFYTKEPEGVYYVRIVLRPCVCPACTGLGRDERVGRPPNLRHDVVAAVDSLGGLKA